MTPEARFFRGLALPAFVCRRKAADMTSRYQLAKADGHRDWLPGKTQFSETWKLIYDQARFHQGAGFFITEEHGKAGPVRKLSEIDAHLKPRLDRSDPDTVFKLTSVKDAWVLLVRRHEVEPSGADLVAAAVTSLVGTPYVFGVTDCSWLILTGAAEVGVELPHNAHAQHLLTSVIKPITRAQLQPWDLLFIHDDDHVAWYAGKTAAGIESVYDTEPSDTTAPAGWPTPMLGTGVRRRPMIGNYYCASINACGRIKAINGDAP